ncbi:MAG: competence/damage-inducible protein A [Flavobacteriaceae bacterium]|nr:competence/damage-inducible protein A [Bacteroidia bacterium]NNF75760.1 competence/damage-inducible protein A [Flavobacteriaceae bacterium]
MQAEIITIGDEILIGQIIDTNSAYIAKQLNSIGISVYQITSVQDDRDHILKSLKEAEHNADIIIITGGLGPTKDDITKNTLAEYFDDHLVQDEAVLRNIESIWRKYIKRPLQQMNIDQALVPSKATALMNLYGSAPGMWLEKDSKVFISLPGVPYEMKALMNNEILPRLRDAYHLPIIFHKTVLTYGLGESMIASRIEAWEDDLPEFIKLAYLPSLGRVRLRLSAKGPDKEIIHKAVEAEIEKLLPFIEDIFVGFEKEGSIEQQIGKILVDKNMTLSTAESCTGGQIAQQITAHPGASEFFKGSVVSYSTESKIAVLGIDESLIDTHSVVSAEVAKAMAAKAKERFNTDYAISTTGNAGPTKGDSQAEVGTVFIGFATPDGVMAEEHHMGNHRLKVIQKTVNKAFEILLKEISKN